MAKITLGKRPPCIESTISAPLPTGETGTVKAQYQYRTRTEFGELIDQRMAEARKPAEPPKKARGKATDAPAAEPAAFSIADLQRQARDANAAYLMDILVGWDIDAPLTLESCTMLCDEAPALAQALIDGYRLAVTEGRLGN